MKPRFLLDCDGILSNFVEPCLEILSRLMGKTYVPEDVTAFNIMASLEIPKDVVTQAYKEMKVEGFCRGLPVISGAQEGVARLKEVAHVFVVTSPIGGVFWAGEREEWLWKYFGIPTQCIVSTRSKYLISGDIIVDDKTAALVEWMKHQSGLPVQWITLHNLDDGWNGPSTDSWIELVGMAKAVQGCPRLPQGPFYRAVSGSEKAV